MKKIFLVHDSQEDSWSRQDYLEQAGYEVTSIPSDVQCLELLTAGRPDLIVMDILIEGRNGFEVCRDIRRTIAPAEMPIILCSEIYRSNQFREEGRNAGAQAYVLKPCEPAELLREIQRALGLPEDPGETAAA